MEQSIKEVMYGKYCPTCQFKDVDEANEPCEECLEQFFRDGSEKPVKYVAKVAKSQKNHIL